MKAMLIKVNSVCMYFRNHRYVAAPNGYQPSLEIYFSPLAARVNPGFPYFYTIIGKHVYCLHGLYSAPAMAMIVFLVCIIGFSVCLLITPHQAS
jgi:hypothetical protein